jgi:hypothetical protein
VYARYSYMHEIRTNGLPLGPILDGGQNDITLAENFMLSETHSFTQTLTNEFRFGYNWLRSQYLQPNANNTTLAASLGLGNVPTAPNSLGGLPLATSMGPFSNGALSVLRMKRRIPTRYWITLQQYLATIR